MHVLRGRCVFFREKRYPIKLIFPVVRIMGYFYGIKRPGQGNIIDTIHHFFTLVFRICRGNSARRRTSFFRYGLCGLFYHAHHTLLPVFVCNIHQYQGFNPLSAGKETVQFVHYKPYCFNLVVCVLYQPVQ